MASKIKGLDELKRKFRLLPIEMRKQMHEALKKNVQELTTLQKSIAVRRPGGGALKRSIQYKFYDPLKAEVSVGDRSSSKSRKAIFYATYVEFGTRPGKRARKATATRRAHTITHPGTKPQPFFWPVYRALKRRMKGRTARAVNKAAKAVGAK